MLERVPHIIILHCIAHKLELAVLDAVKTAPYLARFEEILKAVFKMYYYPPKKRRELKEIGSISHDTLCHFKQTKEPKTY